MKKMQRVNALGCLPAATLLSALTGGSSAWAASDTNTQQTELTAVEEIFVTARKREESLQDVPISVAVVSGERLEAAGLTRLEAATQLLPAVTVAPGPAGDQIFVRGIGSGQNQGFEMSVGTFVDGVYFGRGRSARQPFLDVSRIEVLKGPQPILFGKNTIGGAFNITTRRPTKEFEASIDAYWEPEFDTYQATGVISGPLSDTFGARIVGRSSRSDGYLSNSLTGDDEMGRDDWAVRAVLAWEPSDDLSITLKAEINESSLTGGYGQIAAAAPTLRALVGAIDPRAEYNLDYDKSGPGTIAPYNSEWDNNDAYNFTLTADWSVGEHTLTSISSYIGYEVDYGFDVDFTPMNLVHQWWDQEYSAWSQELRLDSPSGDQFEYTVGIYVAREDLSSQRIMPFNFPAVPPLALLGTGQRVQNFEQDTDDWSAFAELRWHATQNLSVVAGLRYTDDSKSAWKDMYWAEVGSLTLDPARGTRYSALGLGTPHAYYGLERSTDNLSGAITVEYHLGDVMYYGSYSTGFKSGGFDEGNATGNLNDIVFDDESADAIEIGLKARVLDDRATMNLSLFRAEYDDLQVSAFDGVASLVVGNAARSKSQGAELESQWVVSSRLQLNASLTWLDAKYQEYRGGACYAGRPGPACDLSGERLQYAPELSAALSANWDDVLMDSWRYTLRADANYSDEFYAAADLDPFLMQEAFWKLNARVSVYSTDGRWEFSVVGNNLTDETTFHFGDDIPLSNLLGNNYEAFVDAPRTIGLQARYRFSR
ncbi:MAG TPA: TonB-dependent receptor [Steroidobacter sp.]|uniref:TonB-dependent receptor n=1 Tax=Steroidobacter sp. TaxID=1978227 RepID=UPI002ED86931